MTRDAREGGAEGGPNACAHLPLDALYLAIEQDDGKGEGDGDDEDQTEPESEAEVDEAEEDEDVDLMTGVRTRISRWTRICGKIGTMTATMTMKWSDGSLCADKGLAMRTHAGKVCRYLEPCFSIAPDALWRGEGKVPSAVAPLFLGRED